MRAAKSSVLTIWAGVDDAASDLFLLRLHENFTRNDGLMAVFYIILWNDAMVLYPRLREEVRGICLLQEGFADIFLITQNLVDVAGTLFFAENHDPDFRIPLSVRYFRLI